MAEKVRQNMLDDTTWEFLRGGWWVVHIVSVVVLLWLGRALFR